MSFLFIENGALDSHSKKLIRSQAARGRHRGQKRPSRRGQLASVIKTPFIPRPPLFGIQKPEDETPCSKSDMTVSSVERAIGGTLSTVAFPSELTPRSRPFVQRFLSYTSGSMVPVELSGSVCLGSGASLFTQLLFTDEAYFHSTVAISIVAARHRFMTPEYMAEALQHLSFTLRLVNKRLSGEGALRDETMAVVLSMTMFDRLQEQYSQGMIHFAGLLKMVDLWGGISRLVALKPKIAQKIFRTDIDFALYFGSATIFDVDMVPGKGNVTWLRDTFQKDLEDLLRYFPVLNTPGLKFKSAFEDITAFTCLLNTHTAPPQKLGEESFHNMVLFFWYRLINANASSGVPCPGSIDSILYLGLCFFMMTFWRGMLGTHLHFPPLQELAYSTLRDAGVGQNESLELLLWTLFLGHVSETLQPSDDSWLIPKAGEVARMLGLGTWQDMYGVLTRHPFVVSLQAKAAAELWAKLKI